MAKLTGYAPGPGIFIFSLFYSWILPPRVYADLASADGMAYEPGPGFLLTLTLANGPVTSI